MKISDLIAQLQKFDPETRVMVKGFDADGYDDAGLVQQFSVVQADSGFGHIGRYKLAETVDEPHRIGPAFDAVLLNFQND